MRLFETDKVGCYCDTVGHALENRRGTEVKVVQLGLRVTPLSAELASTMADGIKPTLFAMSDATAKVTRLRGATFQVADLKRQRLTVFATPETVKPSMSFDQALIGQIKARVGKDRTEFDIGFSVTFGPVGPKELEFVQAWHLSHKFVTFEAAEPLFDMESGDENEAVTDADEKSSRRFVPPAAPEWEDDASGSGKPVGEAGDADVRASSASDAPNAATADAERSVGVRQRLHSHQTKKKGGKPSPGAKPSPTPDAGKSKGAGNVTPFNGPRTKAVEATSKGKAKK